MMKHVRRLDYRKTRLQKILKKLGYTIKKMIVRL